MRQFISSMLVIGLLSFSTVGLVGCGEESKVETKETVKSPEGGTTTTTDKHTVESSGNNPPPNSAGEKAK